MRHFDVWQKVREPEVKRIVIISHKHRIHEFSHELPNDFSFRTLGNYEISRRCQNFMSCSLGLNLAPEIKILSILAKILAKLKLNFSRRVLFRRKAAFRLRYFSQDFVGKKYFSSNAPPGHLKFDLFKIFGNSKDFNTILA